LISNKLLLDTNIIIYYFNGIITDTKIDQILKESFNISIITKLDKPIPLNSTAGGFYHDY